MKKIFITICAILVTLVLVGCKKEEVINVQPDEIVEFSTDLEGVYNAIISVQPEDKKEELILFKESNEELINSYYEGLADIELAEKNFYMHPVGFACEIALVKANNIEDVSKIKNIFEARIQKGIEIAMCDSTSQAIWKTRAEIQTKDKYVCLIVLPEGYNIPKKIFSLEINQIIEDEKQNIVDYKAKYEEKLNNLQIKDMYSEYALYDIDEDNIPEMIVKSGMSEADTQITIYDIINNELNEITIEEFGGHTNIVGATDINTIILQYGQMDYEKVAVLHYNQDGTYETEIIKEEVVDPQLGYIPFEALKMYQFEDKEGLNWNQNPDDENYWYINAGNVEI